MKNRPKDFPPDIEIPMGVSWSRNNGWTVRRTIKKVKSKPMYFKDFGDAMDYYNVLFEDVVQRKLKLKTTLNRAGRLVKEKQERIEEDNKKRAETIKDKLSLDNLHLLNREQIKEKIAFYMDCLDILYDRDTELWYKEMADHGL